MSSYYLKFWKNTESIKPRVSKLIMVKQWFQNVQYVVVNIFKIQETSGILSNLVLKTPLNKI